MKRMIRPLHAPRCQLLGTPPPSAVSSSRLRVALAECHTLVRDAVRRIIAAQEDMEVVDEAGDGSVACATSHLSESDVTVLDLRMPVVDGVEATRQIKRTRPSTKVVGLSAVKTPEFIREFFSAGGDGFVFKFDSAEELVNAIRGVQRGIVCPDPEILNRLGQPDSPELSSRETRLLRLFAKGYSNKEISALLEISTKTVETVKARAMQKARLNSRVDIVRYGAERGWLLPE